MDHKENVIPITSSRKLRQKAMDYLRKVMDEKWPQIEPIFIEEFEPLMIRKVMRGEDPSPQDYEEAAARVMRRTGMDML